MARSWGLFISFEGLDGVGKTTLVKKVCHQLVDDDIKYMATREPGGSPISEQIRKLVKDPDFDSMDYRTEALLMMAARAQLVHRTYRPALAEGAVLVADRYTDSTLAYQAYGRGLDLESVIQINNFATEGLTPDRTYLLDAPLDIISERMAKQSRGKDRLDKEAKEFFTKVQHGYMQLAQAEPQRFLVIDATQSADQIFSQVYQDFTQLKKSLNLKS